MLRKQFSDEASNWMREEAAKEESQRVREIIQKGIAALASQPVSVPDGRAEWTAKMHRAGVDAVKKAFLDWDCNNDDGANHAAIDIVHAVSLAAPNAPESDTKG